MLLTDALTTGRDRIGTCGYESMSLQWTSTSDLWCHDVLASCMLHCTVLMVNWQRIVHANSWLHILIIKARATGSVPTWFNSHDDPRCRLFLINWRAVMLTIRRKNRIVSMWKEKAKLHLKGETESSLNPLSFRILSAPQHPIWDFRWLTLSCHESLCSHQELWALGGQSKEQFRWTNLLRVAKSQRFIWVF